MLDKKGVVINKLVMVIMVIIVITLVLTFIFKFDVKGWLEVFPSLSEPASNNPFLSESDSNKVFLGDENKQCEMKIASLKQQGGKKWYIVMEEELPLYLKNIPGEIKIEKKGLLDIDFIASDPSVGEILNSGEIRINDNIEERISDLKLVEKLKLLDKSYYFRGLGENILCKKLSSEETKEKELTKERLSSVILYAKENPINNRKCLCDEKCDSYAEFVMDASNRYGPPPLLLVSMMMQESNCVWSTTSGQGKKQSVGLMQISDWELCKNELNLNSKEDVAGEKNIQKNINCGAIILKKNYDRWEDGRYFRGCDKRGVFYSGWEAALRGYVGWGCAPGHDNYVENVMGIYEKLEKVLNE